ncbi:DUF222 domain-containing protein [Glutamicibacter sp. NPDC087344]|uniref:HNH endonuclease signature motif containing protein n=1 Tax=Glutamicibacter sp. NPDC087344 TaxID=3363994 RepID=UPI0037FD9161
MSIHQLAAALQVLREVFTGSIPRGAAAVVLEVMASCCALLVKLSEVLRGMDDPRVAAAHAQLVEDVSHYCQREQLRSQIHLESTGAHLLADQELSALRAAHDANSYTRLNLAAAPKQHSGRAHYQNTEDFTASWLGLNYHGAAARLKEAHLLIARRGMDGSARTPRLARLAQLYTAPGNIDPSRIIQAARALDKLEPADTCFEGAPLPPTARHRDGAFMQDHVLAALSEPNRTTSEKLVSALFAEYRADHGKNTSPSTGIFFRGTRGDVDCYDVRTKGEQAEQLRSLLGQADNPRTEAGKAARNAKSTSTHDGAQNSASGDTSHQDAAPPQDTAAHDDLFSSSDPAPPWAGIDSEPEETINLHQRRAEADATQETLCDETEQDFEFVDSAEEAAEAADGQRHTDFSDQDPELGGDADVSPAQRRLNAFLAALMAGNAANGRKTITPRVGIHIQLESLEDLRHPERLSSTTDHGLTLNAAETGRLICEGAIYRVIFGPDGQPLDVGRTQRFFTEAIKRAALARDRGCIVPGCTAPPEMIEYHHDDWWEHGGKTSCRNASCLCRRHHLAIHAGLLTLVKIGGLAHILFPKHLDPLQIPQRNRVYTAA